MCNPPNLIVIADDDPDDVLFLFTVLHSLPLELTVITVPNGERLIQILEDVSPHLIFLDINMPKKDGFATLKHIRSNKRSIQPVVIMCSTSSCAQDIKMAQEIGADMYFTKPNDIRHLHNIVRDIFEVDWIGQVKESIPGTLLQLTFNNATHFKQA